MVLDSPGNVSERSWNLLDYDVGDGHNDAGADAKIYEKVVAVYPKSCTLCCLLTIYTMANQRPTVVFIRTLLFLSFCFAPKIPSPLFLYIPDKKPSFNDSMNYRLLSQLSTATSANG